jgi:hypothetical protein
MNESFAKALQDIMMLEEQHAPKKESVDEQINDQIVMMEYLEGYFGGELNESTSDDDIMEAFNELLETADAVREFMIQEGAKRDRRVVNAVATQLQRAKGDKRLTDLVVAKHKPTMDAIVAKGDKGSDRRQAFQDRETLAGRKHGNASSRADRHRYVSRQVRDLAGANADGGRRGRVPLQIDPKGHVVAPGEEPSRRSRNRAKRRDALEADRKRTAADRAASTAANDRNILNKVAKNVSAIPQKRRTHPPTTTTPKPKTSMASKIRNLRGLFRR